MHLHILGICGTFMGGLALIARRLGFEVSGSDLNVYPPMSTQLEEQGIKLIEGYDPKQLEPAPDCVIVGNALSRGNPCVEYILDKGLRYTSGPQWLSENVLANSWVVAVAGTHGKTTTSAMIACILQEAGLNPSFLIGGIPNDFGVSARVSESPFFVIEADEYDTAFFDKRSKFVHYHPRTTLLNNIEYDHADIFPDLHAVLRHFHQLIRIVPSNGLIIRPKEDANVDEAFAMGCWTPKSTFGANGKYAFANEAPDFSAFDVMVGEKSVGRLAWNLIGQHNCYNALAAIAAAKHCGVKPAQAVAALSQFKGVKRRMELSAEVNEIKVYDDFAHHPSAIASTLAGVRQATKRTGRILAVVDPRSNTMKMGAHADQLPEALADCDKAFLFEPEGIAWSINSVFEGFSQPLFSAKDVMELASEIVSVAEPGDRIVIMSNGGFGGIHGLIAAGLKLRFHHE